MNTRASGTGDRSKVDESSKRGASRGERRGGRQKGTPNKITADIMHTLAVLDCDPIQGMILIAKDAKNDSALRLKAYSELAQYVYPKRRSIEVTPGKMHPTGARLMTLEELLSDYREAKG